MTITDSAAGSPQAIALTGTGNSPPAVSYSTSSLSYGLQQVGTETGSQQVTLTNIGGSPLALSGIGVTGPNASSFVFRSTCLSSLASGAQCTLHGHFAPTVAKALTASLTISTGLPVAHYIVHLSGTGTLAPTTVALSALSLIFGPEPVQKASASQSVTLTNTGASTLDIRGIQVGGADSTSFVFDYTCGATLAPAATCTIHGHFAPRSSGLQTAVITITDSAGNSPQVISLTGDGN